MRHDIFETIETLWAIAPIPLAILLGRAKSRSKKQERLLRKLADEDRIDRKDYRECGLNPPEWLPETRPQIAPEDWGMMPPPAAVQPTFDRTSLPPEHVLPPIRTELPPPAEPADDVFPQTAAAVRREQHSEPEQTGMFRISAISVMLAVGVVLVVVAGLLFVRSQWDNMADGGKLAILGAGSVLFFGVSALAHRLWNLERTGMAFFTIGAAFLPISIWAAGYFNLLGSGFSGASNKWTITLAFAAFTFTALAALPIYKRTGWGIAALFGFSATYFYFSYALTDMLTDEMAPVLLSTAIYAVILIFTAHLLKDRLPEAVGKAIVPFSIGFAALTCVMQFACMGDTEEMAVTYAAAALFSAACWFAPSAAAHLKNWAAIPVGIMSFYGFTVLFQPMFDNAVPGYFSLSDSGMFQFTAIVCILLMMLLLGVKAVPEQMQKGIAKLPLVYGGLALVLYLCDYDYSINLLVMMTVLMLALMAASILKKPAKRAIPQAAAAVTAMCGVKMLYDILRLYSLTNFSEAKTGLICALVLIGISAVFLAIPRLHSVTGGILFPIGIVGFAAIIPQNVDMVSWYHIPAVTIAALTAVYLWIAALHRNEVKPIRYAYAVMLPMSLLMLTRFIGAVFPDIVSLTVWSVLSFAAAFGAYYTSKTEFHRVRRLLFAAVSVPPMIAAVFAEAITENVCIVTLQAVSAAAAIWMYRIFAKRGYGKYAVGCCGIAVFLLTEFSAYQAANLLYECYSVLYYRFPVFMLAGIVLILLGVLAFLIRRRVVFFVGSDALASAMAAAAAIYSLLLANRLLNVDASAWHNMLFLYTIGFCALGWALTKAESAVNPVMLSVAMLMSIEAVREQATEVTPLHLAGVIACAGILTLLLPYLGAVLRENAKSPAETRRGWVVTASSALYPLWLLFITAGFGGVYYNRKEARWLLFFMMVYAAGYVVHFRFTAKDEKNKRMLGAIAGGMLTVAMWMQPIINVNGTYWENKLHLLPMIAFGVWIRYLYGAAVGGNFLFAIGTYSMLRLGFAAMGTEAAADLLTVLAAATAIFVISFIRKEKKWFVLGGCSLLALTAYLQIRVMHGVVWWVYLLIIGVILIAVAGVNEMMKQRGESLKAKAGRFWQDWTW